MDTQKTTQTVEQILRRIFAMLNGEIWTVPTSFRIPSLAAIAQFFPGFRQ